MIKSRPHPLQSGSTPQLPHTTLTTLPPTPLHPSMAMLSAETQGAGLWKRRTLPNILPSSIDLSRLQPPSSTAAHPAKPSASPPRGQSPPHPGASRQGRKNSAVWRRTSSRASIFSTSPERPGSSVTATPRQAFSAFSSTRPTRKFMYSLAAVTMHTRSVLGLCLVRCRHASN